MRSRAVNRTAGERQAASTQVPRKRNSPEVKVVRGRAGKRVATAPLPEDGAEPELDEVALAGADGELDASLLETRDEAHAEEELETAAAESDEADEEPEEDEEKAESEKRTSRDEPSSYLSMYFRDMARLAVLRPQEEFE